MTTEILSPSQIIQDGGAQSRAAMNRDTIDDYRQAIDDARRNAPGSSAWPFPPIDVYYDGAAYHLADGFHRLAAAREAGLYRVPATIHQGTRRDAVLHSVGANATHGLRRTNADKRRAVETLLRDDEWGQWSDREIARRCHVSHPTVAAIRAELAPVTGKFTSERTYTDRYGNEAIMETANIGGNGSVTTVSLPPAPTTCPECGGEIELTEDKVVGNRMDLDARCLACKGELHWFTFFGEKSWTYAYIRRPNNVVHLTVTERQTQLNEDAYHWLAQYTDQWNRTWLELEPNQIHHANSPCYQAFIREYPSDRDHKFALKQALARLLREDDSADIATFEEPEEEEDVIHVDGGGQPEPVLVPEGAPDEAKNLLVRRAQLVDAFAHKGNASWESVIARLADTEASGHEYTVRLARQDTGLDADEIVQAASVLLKLHQDAKEPDPEARRYDGYQRQTFVNDYGQTETRWVAVERPQEDPVLKLLKQAEDAVGRAIAAYDVQAHFDAFRKTNGIYSSLLEVIRLYEYGTPV